jgi:hypothetical protein
MSVRHRYLEITFRNGRPLAAYLYLPRQPGDKSARTVKHGDSLRVDFTDDGRPIGIEITDVRGLSLDDLNRALEGIHEAPATLDELAPLGSG